MMKGRSAERRDRWIAALLSTGLIVSLCVAANQAYPRKITDMAGRSVTIGRVTRLWSAYPPITYLVYALDPSLLIGWTIPVSSDSRKYLAPPSREMPVIGGWFGDRTPNLESLAAAKPDLALVWDQSLSAMPSMADRLQNLQIPVAAVNLLRLGDYPKAIRFLGDILDRRERAHVLASYIEESIHELESFSRRIPEKEKLSVFYAVGTDGLTSDCDHMPFLNEAIELAGGRNAHHCAEAHHGLDRKIDMERLLLYNPDVILTQEDMFFSRVYSDKRYSPLKAVTNQRVYLIPKVPFNWLNRPPSFMRAVGIRWLAKTLYPNQYKGNLKKETKRFFKLFMGVDIQDAEVESILNPKRS
jgi:iron complex transport system substrate-binding protein